MDASYQAFSTESDEESDIPPDSAVKIHIPPASQVTRWSHIEDLDSFFSNIYHYHQKHGFYCILLKGCFELFKVIFTVVFCVFLSYFVDYDILFHNKLPNHNNNSSSENTNVGQLISKITISDVICPLHQCFNNISLLTWICIYLIIVFWIFRLIKLSYNLYHFWDIKEFFNIALQIPDNELDNVTWHEVQRKVCEVQQEQLMCIRKVDLTELDIYHRILRSKNYMVAMINKNILPIRHNIPLIGPVCYLSQGLKFNIEQLIFSGPWGLFENWNLKEDYKKSTKRHELASKLRTTIIWFAITNLIFGAFIFVWQLVYFFFNYAEVLKREPGALGVRCWSLYGRLYLRHFNELDHELDARLKRAYRPASKYMNTFSCPMMIIVAQSVIFIAGSILAVLVALTIYDEDVLLVEHVLTIMTVLGAIIAVCRGVIPDENMCWCPETLMIEILAEVHYLPDSWRGKIHTTPIRDQFAEFFQYRAVNLLYELISPVMTPLILFFKLRPRSLEIIDFYRNFTVTVVGVGDVCSFSLMDMRKHGNPTWQTPRHLTVPENNKQTQAEDGKTELSLMHFVTMNPTWQPPQEAREFIDEIKENAWRQVTVANDKHSEALSTVSAGLSVILPHPGLHSISDMRRSRAEGPMYRSCVQYNPMFIGNEESATDGNIDGARSVHCSNTPSISMSINTLYLHSLHHKTILEDSLAQVSSSNIRQTLSGPSTSTIPRVFEDTPLLKNLPRSS